MYRACVDVWACVDEPPSISMYVIMSLHNYRLPLIQREHVCITVVSIPPLPPFSLPPHLPLPFPLHLPLPLLLSLPSHLSAYLKHDHPLHCASDRTVVWGGEEGEQNMQF